MALLLLLLWLPWSEGAAFGVLNISGYFTTAVEKQAATLALEDLQTEDFFGDGDYLSMPSTLTDGFEDLSSWGTAATSSGVVAAFGTFSTAQASGVSTQFSAATTPLIAAGITGNPSLSDVVAYPYFLRIGASDTWVADMMAKLVLALGWTRVTILASDDVYGSTGQSALASALSSLAVQTITLGTAATVAEATAALAPLEASGYIGTLIFYTEPTLTKTLLEALYTIDTRGSGWAYLMSPANIGVAAFLSDEALSVGKGALAVYPHTFAEEGSVKAARFPLLYEERWGEEPSLDAAFTYDSVYSIATAVKALKSAGQPITGASVMTELRKVVFNGVTRTIEYSAGSNARMLDKTSAGVFNMPSLRSWNEIGYLSPGGVLTQTGTITWPGQESSAPTGNVYRIAFIGGAEYGDAAVKYAVSYVNENNLIGGSDSLEIVFTGRSNCSEAGAATVGRELIAALGSTDIFAILGVECANDLLGLRSTATELSANVFSMGSQEDSLSATQEYPWFWQMQSTSRSYMSIFLGLIDFLGWRHFHFVYTNDVEGTGAYSAALSIGATLGITFSTSSVDPSGNMTAAARAAIRSAQDGGHKIVFCWSTVANLDVELLTAMYDLGHNSTDVVFMSPQDNGGSASHKLVAMRPRQIWGLPGAGELLSEFVSGFAAAYPSEAPSNYHRFVFDSVLTVAQAIKDTKGSGVVTGQAIQTALRSVRVSGASGTVSFSLDANSRDSEAPSLAHSYEGVAVTNEVAFDGPTNAFTLLSPWLWQGILPISCPAGTFGNRTDESTTCVPCSSGSWAAKDAEACSSCNDKLCPFGAATKLEADALDEQDNGSDPMPAGDYATDEDVELVNIVFGIIGASLFVLLFCLGLVSSWTACWPKFEVFDRLFKDKHDQPVPGPRVVRKTPLGGMISLMAAALGVWLVAFIVTLAVVDRYVIIQGSREGFADFHKNAVSPITVVVSWVGVDDLSFCETAPASSSLPDAVFTTVVNDELRTCEIHYAVPVSISLGLSFTLDLTLPGTRAAAVRYYMYTDALGEERQLNATQILKPSQAESVLFGTQAQSFSVTLQPTVYMGSGKVFDNVKREQIYAYRPFEITGATGSTRDASDYFDSAPQGTGVAVDVLFNLETTVATFKVEDKQSVTDVIANLAALSSLLLLILGVVLLFSEKVLAKMCNHVEFAGDVTLVHAITGLLDREDNESNEDASPLLGEDEESDEDNLQDEEEEEDEDEDEDDDDEEDEEEDEDDEDGEDEAEDADVSEEST